MAATFLLPPHLPVVWTSDSSFQVGIFPPVVSVADVPAEATPLLHALMHGVSEGGIAVLSLEYRLDKNWVTGFLTQLAPALEHPRQTLPELSWQLWGSSPATKRFLGMAHASGLDITHVTQPPPAEADNRPTVVISDYLIHPHWVDHLTRVSRPHVPVVFFDQAVTIGPMIRPGITPCLICRETWDRETTPAWLEIGSQLWGKASPLHHPMVHAAVFSAIIDILVEDAYPGVAPRQQRALFRPDEGVTTWHDETFHPRCTCRGMGESPR